jgi:hypothetical protein
MTSKLFSAVAAVALISTPVLAQQAPGPGGDAPGGAAGAAAGVAAGGGVSVENPFSVANIDPANPFGTVDVTMAGANAESMQAWAASLNTDLKTEISQRCDVISANTSTFPADAVGFCTTWTTVQANEAVPPAPGGAVPAPM